VFAFFVRDAIFSRFTQTREPGGGFHPPAFDSEEKFWPIAAQLTSLGDTS